MEKVFCKDHPAEELENANCFKCGGEGFIEVEDDYGDETITKTCWQCSGFGIIENFSCFLCEEELVIMEHEENKCDHCGK